MFGSSLVEICAREETAVPRFVRVCTEAIERRGLDQDGLYRISGNLSQIQKIRCQVRKTMEGSEGSGSLWPHHRLQQEEMMKHSLTNHDVQDHVVQTD